MVDIKREKVTPAFAESLLQKNVLNRKISSNRVLHLAAQMKSGRWADNGDTIKLSKSGFLMDGQHRLAAVIYSGVTITTTVAYNVPDEAFHTIDTNRSRKAGDVLTIEGYSSGVHLAGGVATLWKVFAKVPRTTPVPLPYISEIIERYPAVADYAIQSRDAMIRRLIPASVFIPAMTYLIDIAGRAPDLAKRFVSGIVKGDGLLEGDPMLAYRNRVINYRLDQNAKLDAGTLWPLTVRLMDALEGDDRLVKMKMAPSSGPLDQPRLFEAHVLGLPVKQRLTDLISGNEINSREGVRTLIGRVSAQPTKRKRA